MPIPRTHEEFVVELVGLSAVSSTLVLASVVVFRFVLGFVPFFVDGVVLVFGVVGLLFALIGIGIVRVLLPSILRFVGVVRLLGVVLLFVLIVVSLRVGIVSL